MKNPSLPPPLSAWFPIPIITVLSFRGLFQSFFRNIKANTNILIKHKSQYTIGINIWNEKEPNQGEFLAEDEQASQELGGGQAEGTDMGWTLRSWGQLAMVRERVTR